MRHLICGITLAFSVPLLAAPTDLAEVLARAAAAVTQLETTLATVIVEERSAQTAETERNLGGSSFGSGGGAMAEKDTVREKRQSRSELLLVRRPTAPRVWSGVRNVLDIDGKTTGATPGRLDQVAADPLELSRQWSSLSDDSRKVHLGVVDRDPHVAFTALALLRDDQRARLSFRKDGEEKVRGVATWKVAFAETKGPTIVVSRANVPLGARGTLWIDPESGRVWRTRLEAGDDNSAEQHRIDVEYALDATLGVPVPIEMKEHYENARGKVDAKVSFSAYRTIGAK